jgi:hypothetical protein
VDNEGARECGRQRRSNVYAAARIREQADFNKLGTNYSLSKAQVANLIAAADRILRASPNYQEVVRLLQTHAVNGAGGPHR